MGLQETRRPFVSSGEVVSAQSLKRSAVICLLLYLSMDDLVTGRGLQATQPSQVHHCYFPLQQLLARKAGTESPYYKCNVYSIERVKNKSHRIYSFFIRFGPN